MLSPTRPAISNVGSVDQVAHSVSASEAFATGYKNILLSLTARNESHEILRGAKL
ncbi:MAG: hypothetical protein V4447_07595 [Pseudomonadota bacterium]